MTYMSTLPIVVGIGSLLSLHKICTEDDYYEPGCSPRGHIDVCPYGSGAGNSSVKYLRLLSGLQATIHYNQR